MVHSVKVVMYIFNILDCQCKSLLKVALTNLLQEASNLSINLYIRLLITTILYMVLYKHGEKYVFLTQDTLITKVNAFVCFILIIVALFYLTYYIYLIITSATINLCMVIYI